jgi:hypothetical protein
MEMVLLEFKGTVQWKLRGVKIGINRSFSFARKCHLPLQLIKMDWFIPVSTHLSFHWTVPLRDGSSVASFTVLILSFKNLSNCKLYSHDCTEHYENWNRKLCSSRCNPIYYRKQSPLTKPITFLHFSIRVTLLIYNITLTLRQDLYIDNHFYFYFYSFLFMLCK